MNILSHLTLIIHLGVMGRENRLEFLPGKMFFVFEFGTRDENIEKSIHERSWNLHGFEYLEWLKFVDEKILQVLDLDFSYHLILSFFKKMHAYIISCHNQF